MIIRYKHTQVGMALLFALGVAILMMIVAFFYANAPMPAPLIFGVVAIVLLISAVLFASLTIEIRDHLLCWRFGPGLIRKNIELTDIQAVEAVKNPWWFGIGIHLTPRGWLYNVSGLQGVEITLKNGKHFRLGTDEPDDLARAIKDAISSVRV